MTNIGTIIDGKYEILKEIGRGGMSVVYLAMDKRLNKQWAVKEIRKKSDGKNAEIVINSLLAEANMMKKLDHPALPRIVDIIDNGITIYVIMDYIEGESLDKILEEYGAQPEELVIAWAKQLCDVLSYLHSQKPPIIYRDMKPANIMLKPEGNIKIIDFGIAREYKEQNLADTTVLGTKGYAPPEQYSGQTDARSDIFALGMTMHHLLTGVDPRGGEPYASVRQWNPELSEGIELIIDRCVEPAAENRYQTCADLLYDLEHPELITKGFKKQQKRKLGTFIASAAMSVVMAISGFALNTAATYQNNQDYDVKLALSDPEAYYQAVNLYPERVEAYNQLIEHYKNSEASNDDIKRVGNAIDSNYNVLDVNDGEIADMYYDMGKLYFAEYDGGLKERANYAREYFAEAVESSAEYDKKDVAICFAAICDLLQNQGTTSEPALQEYEAVFEKINSAVAIIDQATDNESNYDKISLYYTAMLVINDQVQYFAPLGYPKEEVLTLMESLYKKSMRLGSQLAYVQRLQEEIDQYYDDFMTTINSNYSVVESRTSELEEEVPNG